MGSGKARGREPAPITTLEVQRSRFKQSIEWGVSDYWVAFGRPVDASTLSRRFRSAAIALDVRLDWVFRELCLEGRLHQLLTTRMSMFYLPENVWARMSTEERENCYLSLPMTRAGGRPKGSVNRRPELDE